MLEKYVNLEGSRRTSYLLINITIVKTTNTTVKLVSVHVRATRTLLVCSFDAATRTITDTILL